MASELHLKAAHNRIAFLERSIDEFMADCDKQARHGSGPECCDEQWAHAASHLRSILEREGALITGDSSGKDGGDHG